MLQHSAQVANIDGVYIDLIQVRNLACREMRFDEMSIYAAEQYTSIHKCLKSLKREVKKEPINNNDGPNGSGNECGNAHYVRGC